MTPLSLPLLPSVVLMLLACERSALSIAAAGGEMAGGRAIHVEYCYWKGGRGASRRFALSIAAAAGGGDAGRVFRLEYCNCLNRGLRSGVCNQVFALWRFFVEL